MSDTIRQRLRDAIGGRPVSAVASESGVPYSSLRQYLNKSDPGLQAAAQLAEALGVSLEWLATGRGSREAHKLPSQADLVFQSADGSTTLFEAKRVPVVDPAHSSAGVAAFALADDPAKIYVRLPLYAPRVSAGPGLAVQHEALEAHMLFSADWLWRTLHRPPEMLICLQAHGDSMYPRIQNGDVLIVDTSVDRIKDHGVYCFSYEGDLMVKRLQRSLSTGVLRIISENEQHYPVEELPKSEADRINVIGLVVWHGGIAR